MPRRKLPTSGAALTGLDYSLLAEVYPGQRKGHRGGLGYRRFSAVADALKFLIEDLPPADLASVVLEVDEVRYRPDEIRALYDAAEYPLARSTGPTRSSGNGNQ